MNPFLNYAAKLFLPTSALHNIPKTRHKDVGIHPDERARENLARPARPFSRRGLGWQAGRQREMQAGRPGRPGRKTSG